MRGGAIATRESESKISPLSDRLVVSPPRPPTPMTHHPIKQIALEENLKSQESRPHCAISCDIDYFTRRVSARRLNARAIRHGRLYTLAISVVQIFIKFPFKAGHRHQLRANPL